MNSSSEHEALGFLAVEIVYAAAQRQFVASLRLLAGATVGDALTAVATRTPFDELDLATVPVGVFGDRCERDRVLADGDRVEIYRSLHIDPREARRQRTGARRN